MYGKTSVGLGSRDDILIPASGTKSLWEDAMCTGSQGGPPEDKAGAGAVFKGTVHQIFCGVFFLACKNRSGLEYVGF